MKQPKKSNLTACLITLLFCSFLLSLTPSYISASTKNNDNSIKNDDVKKTWWTKAKNSFQDMKKWLADSWKKLTKDDNKDLKDCPKAPSYITKKESDKKSNNEKN